MGDTADSADNAVIDDEVVDAVARILDREGLAGLSFTSIAAEAGLSRVTLHRRGASIDDYLVVVVRRATADIRESMWPLLTGSEPAAVRLRGGLAVVCDVAERHAGVMSSLFGVPAPPIPDRGEITTSIEFVEPFERLLRDGIVDGSLIVDDPRSDATITVNATGWTYLHMRRAHRWPQDRARTRTVDLAIAHLLPAE